MLVIALAALSGWWLAVRPRASYRGICGTMSVLILLMAVLLGLLALGGQSGGRRLPPGPRVAAAR